jgi:hypothetical protein
MRTSYRQIINSYKTLEYLYKRVNREVVTNKVEIGRRIQPMAVFPHHFNENAQKYLSEGYRPFQRRIHSFPDFQKDYCLNSA